MGTLPKRLQFGGSESRNAVATSACPAEATNAFEAKEDEGVG